MAAIKLTKAKTVPVCQKKKRFQALLNGIGVALVCLALATTVLAIVAIAVSSSSNLYHFDLNLIGTGIWCNIPVILTGVLLFISGIKLTVFLLKYTFTSAAFSCVFIVISGGLTLAAGILNAGEHWGQALCALDIVMFAFLVAEMVLSLYVCVMFGRMLYAVTSNDADKASCCGYLPEEPISCLWEL